MFVWSVDDVRAQTLNVVLVGALRERQDLSNAVWNCHLTPHSGPFMLKIKYNGNRKDKLVELRAELPTSSMPRFGSGEMTVRPEKSTRLPERLPRNRPCLPLMRWLNPRIDLLVCWCNTRRVEFVKIGVEVLWY